MNVNLSSSSAIKVKKQFDSIGSRQQAVRVVSTINQCSIFGDETEMRDGMR